MKNFLIAVSIILVITACSITCILYTKRVSENMLDTLDMCEEAVANNNWNLAQENIHLTNSLWHKYRPILAIFLMHSDLNQITDLLTKITAIISVRDRNQFFIENRCLSALVDEISNMDSLTFENLF